MVLMMMNTEKQKQKAKRRNQEAILWEKINSIKEEQSVKPQHHDQSKRLWWPKSFNSTNVFSVSSKEQWFCFIHTIHIKQPRIKFQISELWFPCQLLQQNNNPTSKAWHDPLMVFLYGCNDFLSFLSWYPFYPRIVRIDVMQSLSLCEFHKRNNMCCKNEGCFSK